MGPPRLLKAVPLVAGNRSHPTQIDRGLLGDRALPVLLYFEPGTRLPEIAAGTREAREDLEGQGPLRVGVTGIRMVQYDTKVAIDKNLWLVTVVTTLAIFLVVSLTYRSLLAPLIPLGSIGLATFLTLRILGWIASEWSISIPSQIEPIIVVLLFGVGTDYALFLLSRTRQALEEGAERIEAARLGVEKMGGVLLSSAAVLIAAFALLLLAELGLYTGPWPRPRARAVSRLYRHPDARPRPAGFLGPAAFGERGRHSGGPRRGARSCDVPAWPRVSWSRRCCWRPRAASGSGWASTSWRTCLRMPPPHAVTRS